MKKRLLTTTLILFSGFLGLSHSSFAESDPPSFYRDLTHRLRKQGKFKVFLPGGTDLAFNYQMEFADPVPKYEMPWLTDIDLSGWPPPGPNDPKYFHRMIFDRIFFKDGSILKFGNEELPLTCVFIDGQDNRYSGKDTPLLPDIIYRVYLVAKDYTCNGPINRDFPNNGGRRETWDTYLYYEVRDPTIMLPTEVKIRYRWNEFQAVLVEGAQ